MDFTHNETTSAFEQRAQPLALRDIWYPLVLDKSLAKENKHIHQLWDALNISFDDYFRIITDNNGFWSNIGQGWNLDSHATIEMGREEHNVGQLFQRQDSSIYQGDISWANGNSTCSKWEIANTDGSLWFSLSH